MTESVEPKNPERCISPIGAVLCFSDECSTDTFRIFRDTNANGAREDTASDSVSKCRSSCLCNRDCVGFDFDTDRDECWIHIDERNVEPNRRNDAPGIDLYVREDSGMLDSS